MEAVYAFYAIYDDFWTCNALANIRYSGDLTDTYWEAEYNFCSENGPAVEAALDDLYCCLSDSPLRTELEGDDYFGAGFFEGYEESTYDETLVSLMEKEAQLISQYYELSDAASAAEYYSEAYFSTYGSAMAELYVELVKVRQEIAAYAGYDSYQEYAYDFNYLRNYTPKEATAYLEQVGMYLYDLYVYSDMSDIWEDGADYCTESQTFRYVQAAANAMGGTPSEAFDLLQKARLYDIAYGENKFNSSFEVYLWSYYEPFIFMNPYLDQSDKLTFAHEFGHFTNDYACSGSYAGIDIAEIHSQAFEYLSLCYVDNTEVLTRYKLADSLCVYMENAAYSLFEHQVYDLPAEDLTAENITALYEYVGTFFGFDSLQWDVRDWVTIPHFFTQPMYMVSYVVSNDLAMQIYQLELEQPGEGLALYEECLTSQDSYLLYFAQTYGLQSPFDEGRLEEVAKLFSETFGE